ncbi:MAG TPA: nucleotidyltransferase [Oceanospirillaceae bacterium]|nr:nucleotidyltransferase [Oceanospirillaceae bacterium]
MLLDKLHQHKTQIDALAAQYGATRIRVFGSVARGEEVPGSDVDFLVELPRGYDLIEQRIPLANKLSTMLGRAVDLVPEHELNQYMRQQILAEAVDL